jgi:hypothetical protein
VRIEAGPYYCESSSGEETIAVDRLLSPEQVDLVLHVLKHHGATPIEVSAVEISEGGCSVECPDWPKDAA